MSNCTTCTHPKHGGRRCMVPVIKEVPDPHGSLILTRTEVVGHCACGLVDEMTAVMMARRPRYARLRWHCRRILQDWHSRPPTHSGIDHQRPE